MNRLRRLRTATWDVVTAPYRQLRAWWEPIPPEGQVTFIGLVLVGVGLQAGLISLIVPGAILTAIGMGLNLRRGT